LHKSLTVLLSVAPEEGSCEDDRWGSLSALRSSSIVIATDAVGWREWGSKMRRKVSPSLYLSSAMDGRGCGGQRREGAEATEKAIFPPSREQLTIVVCCPLHRGHCCQCCCLPSCCHHYYQRRRHLSSRHHLVDKTTHPPLAPLAPLGIPLMAMEATSTTPALIAKKTFTQADARSNLRPTMAHFLSQGGRGGVTDDVNNANNNRESCIKYAPVVGIWLCNISSNDEGVNWMVASKKHGFWFGSNHCPPRKNDISF